MTTKLGQWYQKIHTVNALSICQYLWLRTIFQFNEEKSRNTIHLTYEHLAECIRITTEIQPDSY